MEGQPIVLERRKRSLGERLAVAFAILALALPILTALLAAPIVLLLSLGLHALGASKETTDLVAKGVIVVCALLWSVRFLGDRLRARGDAVRLLDDRIERVVGNREETFRHAELVFCGERVDKRRGVVGHSFQSRNGRRFELARADWPFEPLLAYVRRLVAARPELGQEPRRQALLSAAVKWSVFGLLVTFLWLILAATLSAVVSNTTGVIQEHGFALALAPSALVVLGAALLLKRLPPAVGSVRATGDGVVWIENGREQSLPLTSIDVLQLVCEEQGLLILRPFLRPTLRLKRVVLRTTEGRTLVAGAGDALGAISSGDAQALVSGLVPALAARIRARFAAGNEVVLDEPFRYAGGRAVFGLVCIAAGTLFALGWRSGHGELHQEPFLPIELGIGALLPFARLVLRRGGGLVASRSGLRRADEGTSSEAEWNTIARVRIDERGLAIRGGTRSETYCLSRSAENFDAFVAVLRELAPREAVWHDAGAS